MATWPVVLAIARPWPAGWSSLPPLTRQKIARKQATSAPRGNWGGGVGGRAGVGHLWDHPLHYLHGHRGYGVSMCYFCNLLSCSAIVRVRLRRGTPVRDDLRSTGRISS